MKLRLLDIAPYEDNYLLLIENTDFQIKTVDKFEVIVNEETKMQISNLKEFDAFSIPSERGMLLISESELYQLFRLEPRKNKCYLKLIEQSKNSNIKVSSQVVKQNSRTNKSPTPLFFLDEYSPKIK